MLRLLMICSLLGCGLVLDLDPPEPDAAQTDAGRRDSDEFDVFVEDAPPKDTEGLDDVEVTDAGMPRDIPVNMPDVLVRDAGPSCFGAAECPRSTPCRSWECEAEAGALGHCAPRVLIEDGDMCDDGLYCTERSTCEAGRCQGGTPRECGAGTQCSALECSEEVFDCLPQPINTGEECRVPNGLGFCEAGRCRLEICDDGFGDCTVNGICDTNTDVSLVHCGACGTNCVGGICIGGLCVL